MNISITELFSKIVARFSGGVVVQRFMNPTRDWYLALLLWVMVTVSVASVSAYLFFLVDDGGSVSIEETENSGVNRSLLRETLTFFEGERSEFELLRGNPPQIPKPF